MGTLALHLTLSDILSKPGRLSPAEAVALVRSIAEASAKASFGNRAAGSPSPPDIILTETGRIVYGGPTPGNDADRVKQLALLLHHLLAIDDVRRNRQSGDLTRSAPGALLLLVARAAGRIDLPAPSYDDFLRALIPFASGSAPLSDVYTRLCDASPAAGGTESSDALGPELGETAPMVSAGGCGTAVKRSG